MPVSVMDMICVRRRGERGYDDPSLKLYSAQDLANAEIGGE